MKARFAGKPVVNIVLQPVIPVADATVRKGEFLEFANAVGYDPMIRRLPYNRSAYEASASSTVIIGPDGIVAGGDLSEPFLSAKIDQLLAEIEAKPAP